MKKFNNSYQRIHKVQNQPQKCFSAPIEDTHNSYQRIPRTFLSSSPITKMFLASIQNLNNPSNTSNFNVNHPKCSLAPIEEIQQLSYRRITSNYNSNHQNPPSASTQDDTLHQRTIATLLPNKMIINITKNPKTLTLENNCRFWPFTVKFSKWNCKSRPSFLLHLKRFLALNGFQIEERKAGNKLLFHICSCFVFSWKRCTKTSEVAINISIIISVWKINCRHMDFSKK